MTTSTALIVPPWETLRKQAKKRMCARNLVGHASAIARARVS